MQLVAHTAPPVAPPTAHVASPFDRAPVAALDYVLRAPQGGSTNATIVAQVAPDTGELVHGSFTDAVRTAQARASAERMDPFHRQAINPAMGVLQAAGGAYWVTELQGAHRDAVGPIFIDGSFFRHAGLSVIGTRTARELQAVVGCEQLLDLRQAPRDGVEAIDAVLSREPTTP
jgi:hypothetical protein